MGPESIGYRIIHNLPLSVEQADQVYDSLERLNNSGIWAHADWSIEVEKFLHTGRGMSAVQLMGWEAVAKTYKAHIAKGN